MKPVSPSCERNREPILALLREVFADRTAVLEIGSGTGQHAVHFGANLPHLVWHTTDLEENHAGIHAWLNEAQLDNVRPPVALNIDLDPWPGFDVDAVFTANTLHIVSWPRVIRLFRQVAALLPAGGVLATYGPFNYNGEFTSQSNRDFQIWLQYRDPESGIRDFEALVELAGENGLSLEADHPMPANNRTLIWRKA